MDYRTYTLSFSEKLLVVITASALMGVVSYLFYNSMWFMCFTPGAVWLGGRIWMRDRKKKRCGQIAQQFQDAMQVVSTSLLSGYSMENALLVSEEEMKLLYGRDAMIRKELHAMNQEVLLHMPIEKVFSEFARRSGVEDIENFAEVFAFAKRSGGDLIHIIGTTVYHMRAKLEVQREIEVLVAAKRLEQNIMNAVPIFILLYLRLGSNGYLDQMYGNWFGIAFMTGCLGLYLFIILIEQRILQIQV